jgi:hypothetical protein
LRQLAGTGLDIYVSWRNNLEYMTYHGKY